MAEDEKDPVEVRIVSPLSHPGEGTVVEVAGEDVTGLIRSLRVEIGVGSVNEVHLVMLPADLSVELEALVHVHIGDEDG